MVATPAEEFETAAGRVPLPPWPFLESLPAVLQADTDAVAGFREALATGTDSLRQRLEDDEPIEALVRDRARMVDIVLRRAWALHAGPREKDVALIAVGGYGRGELHPCSDIDVLILLPKSEVAGDHEGIERFLAFLWDIGLEVGHSVRTIDDCQRESAMDVSVATTLIEARLLAGPDYLFQAMRRALARTASGRRRPSSRRRSPSSRRGTIATTTPLTTSSRTSRRARAACATSRRSAGSRSGTSAPRPSTSSSTMDS